MDHMDRDHKVQLLIVDDEVNIRAPLVRALTLMGYTVDEATSGSEALLLLEQATYNLMVLDMHMPGIGGQEVMVQARQMQPGLLIVVLTGYPSLDSAIAAVKADAVDYLRKPLSVREIAEAVKQALVKRDSREAVSAESSWSEPEAIQGGSLSGIVRVNSLELDCTRQLFSTTSRRNRAVALTRGETLILASLMSQPDQVVSCQELVKVCWGRHLREHEAQSVVRPHISRIRLKIEPTPSQPQLIRTVRKRGYHFVATPIDPLHRYDE